MKLNEAIYAFVVSDFFNLVKKWPTLFENRLGAREN
jgi:hypothetical protein